MPLQLLPSSAAAFSTRTAPNVVLNAKVDPFLTTTLKRVARRRPLNNVTQHTRCLTELLAGQAALWSLCTLFLQKAPNQDLTKDENPLIEAVSNFEMFTVQAYVVHVDMVSQNEVAFKLTPDTISGLINFHKDVFAVDIKKNTAHWPGKEKHLKQLHEKFVQAVNRYVYRTGSNVLDGMQEEGAGELLVDRANEVKTAVMGLFHPLLPPPPPPPPPPAIIDLVHTPPNVPASDIPQTWWRPAVSSQQVVGHQDWAFENESHLLTTPNVTPGQWSNLETNDFDMPFDSLADCSPASVYTDPCSTTPSPQQFYSLPDSSTSLSTQLFNPLLCNPLPQQVQQLDNQSCNFHAAMDLSNFEWDHLATAEALQQLQYAV